MEYDIEKTLNHIKEKFSSSGGLGLEDINILDEVKKNIVLYLVKDKLIELNNWVQIVSKYLTIFQKVFNVKGYTFPKELTSFMLNPLDHLKKKLFIYIDDYIRGRIDFDTLMKKSSSAIITSVKTNIRSCYQLWGLISILIHLGGNGYEIVYPEHKFVNFDRSGKQKLGIIPPNIVLLNIGKGFLSFFHEAPRPLSWGDTRDLQKVWNLYTALRPDLMIYSGKILNIVDLNSTPPIKRPNIIIEFKETDDWYLRVRDLKGYFRKPMTAEEWRNRWWYRLREELIKIADLHDLVKSIDRFENRVERGGDRSIRVKEYQLILMYKAMYKPDKMFLISRVEVPREVKDYLEKNRVEIYDNTDFDATKLREVSYELDKFASYGAENSIVIELPSSLVQLINKVSEALGLNYVETIEYALKRLLEDIDIEKMKIGFS